MSVVIRTPLPSDRPHMVRFMAGLQEVERALHPSRRPGADVAEAHYAYLEQYCAENQGLIRCAAPEAGLVSPGEGSPGEVSGDGAPTAGAPVGMLIGYVMDFGGHFLHPAYQRVGWIGDLWIEPAYRGGDLLDRMLDDAERHFAGLGLSRLMLAHVHGNARAEGAYRKRGFRDFEAILDREIG